MAVKNVIILRGVPGAGKTWWHKTKFPGPGNVVCSANDYFTDPDGGYTFKPELLHTAHNHCLRKYVRALHSPGMLERAIVDNTNISAIEMAPYIALAEAYDVPYEIVRVYPMNMTVEQLAERCIHDVPKAKIQRMLGDLQTNRLPRFWRLENIYNGGELW